MDASIPKDDFRPVNNLESLGPSLGDPTHPAIKRPNTEEDDESRRKLGAMRELLPEHESSNRPPPSKQCTMGRAIGWSDIHRLKEHIYRKTYGIRQEQRKAMTDAFYFDTDDTRNLKSKDSPTAWRQLGLSNSNASPSDKSQYTSGTTKRVVEGSVDGIRTEALPDTGSDECIISAQFASKLHQKLVPGTKQTITLSNKKKVQSPGMLEVLWKFANEQEDHRLKCWVLPGGKDDFVLGSKFLNMTKTLTTFRHRIKKVFTSSKLRLRLMNEEKQRLLGIFNNHITSALADTGSDLMLVSLDYALQQGLCLCTGKRCRSEVELADGTRIWTHGTVNNATWSVGNTTVQCNFHVLDGLPADVILSKDYLFDLNIFSDHADSFFDLDSVEDLTLLCGIRLVEEEIQDLEMLEEDFLRDVTSQDAFDFDAAKRERRRRLLTVKKIASVPLAERQEAYSHEENRKRRWETARAQHKRLWTRTS